MGKPRTRKTSKADKRRDRRNLAIEKIDTMRFWHIDLRTEQAQCRTAAEVAGVLRDRGPWVGMRCRLPGCHVSEGKAPSVSPGSRVVRSLV
jgi:hypothetical protein